MRQVNCFDVNWEWEDEATPNNVVVSYHEFKYKMIIKSLIDNENKKGKIIIVPILNPLHYFFFSFLAPKNRVQMTQLIKLNKDD